MYGLQLKKTQQTIKVLEVGWQVAVFSCQNHQLTNNNRDFLIILVPLALLT